MSGKKKKQGGRDAKRAAQEPLPREPLPQEAVPLPQTRPELEALHRATRARRNAAPHGSKEHVEAIKLIGRIEIEIARIERAMDPPLV